MKKTKINIRPLVSHTQRVKKNLIKNSKDFNDLYNNLGDSLIFSNLLAMICFFWISRNQNTLKVLIDNKQIKKATFDEPKELLNIFKQIISFSSNKILNLENKNYLEHEVLFQEQSKHFSKLLVDIYLNNSITDSNEIEAIRICFESLLNFNFIDLYTFKLEILNQDEDLSKYDSLILLIEKQMEYLNESYALFKSANSPNFNLIFRSILTLRKKIY